MAQAAPLTNGAAQTSADVLELTQAQALPEMEAAPAHQHHEEAPALHQPMPEPSIAPAHTEEMRADEDIFGGSDVMVVDRDQDAEDEPNALVSGDVESNAATAFQSLGRNVAVSREPSGSRTLETMVEDMMRPMLKEWLDDNLGDIVEDLVDREVRRISDRSRR